MEFDGDPSSAEWHYLRAMALLVGAVEVKGDTYETLHRKTSERIEAMKNPQQIISIGLWGSYLEEAPSGLSGSSIADKMKACD